MDGRCSCLGGVVSGRDTILISAIPTVRGPKLKLRRQQCRSRMYASDCWLTHIGSLTAHCICGDQLWRRLATKSKNENPAQGVLYGHQIEAAMQVAAT